MYLWWPLVRVTLSVADLPGPTFAVFLPAILKSWAVLPLFVTLKMVTPWRAVFVDNTNLNSLAFTVTVVAAAACIRATASGVTASTATRAARTTPVESFSLSIWLLSDEERLPERAYVSGSLLGPLFSLRPQRALLAGRPPAPAVAARRTAPRASRSASPRSPVRGSEGRRTRPRRLRLPPGRAGRRRSLRPCGSPRRGARFRTSLLSRRSGRSRRSAPSSRRPARPTRQ